MLERTVNLGGSPAAIRVIDANIPLSEWVSDDRAQGSRNSQQELARETQERAAFDQVIDRLNTVATQVQEQREQLLHEMQQVAVELAVAVAEQAIYAKLQSGEFPIEGLVRAALERLPAAGPILVRLHPDDLALLKRRVDGATGLIPGGDVQFEPDPTLKRGDCRADTGELGVWNRMRGQLDDMRLRLLESLADAEIERRKTAANDSGLRRFPDRRQTA